VKSLPNPERIENNFRLQQYRNLENWDKIFKILVKRYKKLQVFLQEMPMLLWHINDVTGIQLDNIGHILGVPRLQNTNDIIYRMLIRDTILKNYSGTYPEIKQFLILHTADSEPEIMQEHPFGSIVCFTPNGIEANTAKLDVISAAGILPLIGRYFQMIDDENDVLQFADGSVWLLAGENVLDVDVIFQLAFVLIGGTPTSFTISVNNFNGRENQKEFILYNLHNIVAWQFISNDSDFQNMKGNFEIVDGIFEYKIEINLKAIANPVANNNIIGKHG
jgi:hypothetical protein